MVSQQTQKLKEDMHQSVLGQVESNKEENEDEDAVEDFSSSSSRSKGENDCHDDDKDAEDHLYSFHCCF